MTPKFQRIWHTIDAAISQEERQKMFDEILTIQAQNRGREKMRRLAYFTISAALALAIGLAAGIVAARAQVPDELPYKEDGPERDYYLQTFVRACVQEPHFQKIAANEKEVTQFCECRALFVADIWTTEDDLEFQRSKNSNTKLPSETYEKWRKASISCQKHLSKLPKVPERKK